MPKRKKKTERKSSARIRDGVWGKTHSSISPSRVLFSFRGEWGGGGGRVSPTSWSFYRLLCRRLYEQLLKPFWSYEGLYWTQWTLWNSRRWPVTWREANNVNCRFNPPPPTYKSAQLWAHLPVNKTYKLPGDFETPPDITLLPCSDYNWTPHWIQFITTFKWSLIKNQ